MNDNKINNSETIKTILFGLIIGTLILGMIYIKHTYYQ